MHNPATSLPFQVRSKLQGFTPNYLLPRLPYQTEVWHFSLSDVSMSSLKKMKVPKLPQFTVSLASKNKYLRVPYESLQHSDVPRYTFRNQTSVTICFKQDFTQEFHYVNKKQKKEGNISYFMSSKI
jgi:hypothetical protein